MGWRMAPQYLRVVIVRGEMGHEFQAPASGVITLQSARRRPGRELEFAYNPRVTWDAVFLASR